MGQGHVIQNLHQWQMESIHKLWVSVPTYDKSAARVASLDHLHLLSGRRVDLLCCGDSNIQSIWHLGIAGVCLDPASIGFLCRPSVRFITYRPSKQKCRCTGLTEKPGVSRQMFSVVIAPNRSPYVTPCVLAPAPPAHFMINSNKC